MNAITYETRQMSFEDIRPKNPIRYNQILEILGNREMTAKEIAIEMFEYGLIPSTDRNYAAPRLNELEKDGKVRAIGKKKCEWSGKSVAIYKAISWSEIGLAQGHVTPMDMNL